MTDSTPDDLERSFALLHDQLSTDEARKRMGDHRFGIVVDDAGKPSALVTDADLRDAAERGRASLLDAGRTLPPTVILSGSADLQTLAESGALGAFDAGATGVIVVGKHEADVLGIVDSEQIEAFLGGGGYQLTGTQLGWTGATGDVALPGQVGTGIARVVKFCSVCGFRNEFAFFDRDRLPNCQNTATAEHTLGVDTL